LKRAMLRILDALHRLVPSEVGMAAPLVGTLAVGS
jgi:hypothetical protein